MPPDSFTISGTFYNYQYPDYVCTSNQIPVLAFGVHAQADNNNADSGMVAACNTRINVGLMWGWFTLSPNWQGLFDSGQPTLPASYTAANVSKQLILVVGSRNNVWTSAYGGVT